jgi:uncharacterized membrane protein YcfT
MRRQPRRRSASGTAPTESDIPTFVHRRRGDPHCQRGCARQAETAPAWRRGVRASPILRTQEFNMDRSPIPADRIDWIDYAKGICIIWVVTLYATDYVKEITHSIGWMQPIVNFAQPFRMPDFFLLAGLFVPRAMKRGWRAYADTKILHFIYFYALWGALKLVNLHASELSSMNLLPFMTDYLRIFIVPPTGPLWFIYVLAIFFLAVRLLRHIPAAVVLPLAMVLQIAVTWGDAEWSFKLADKFARYFVFFYSGYVLSPYVFRATAWLRERLALTLAILLCWVVVNQVMVSLHASYLPGMQLLLGYAGAFCLQLSATLLARLSFTGWLRYLGQNSIVVYLGFVIPLGFMRRLVDQPQSMLDLGALSLVVTVASIAGAVLLYWLLRRTPLSILYERPSWTSIQPHKEMRLYGPPAT